jgi:hypothetical protein
VAEFPRSLPEPDPPGAASRHFDFVEPSGAGAPIAQAALRALGVRRGRSGVDVDDTGFTVRFGPWRLRTPLSNIASAQLTGPYSAWKGLGVRLSLADRGLTFGTSTAPGVCIEFREPVPGIEPTGMLRHPGVTVTVERPHELVRALG